MTRDRKDKGRSLQYSSTRRLAFSNSPPPPTLEQDIYENLKCCARYIYIYKKKKKIENCVLS